MKQSSVISLSWNLRNRLTVRISGSLYVTSNSCFFCINHVLDMLNQWMNSDDVAISLMANDMFAKYEKYWGNLERMNVLIYMGAILDPKCKLVGLGIALGRMRGREKGRELYEYVHQKAFELFNEYKKVHGPLAPESGQSSDPMDIGYASKQSENTSSFLDLQNFVHDEVRKSSDYVTSEFDRYLNDDLGEHERQTDILLWWSLNEHRYPIVSIMARDVLAMPVSTVASESAFSTSGRTLDPFRSSLTPTTVQSLICTQDWLRTRATPRVDVEEKLEDLERIEKDLEKLVLSEGDKDEIVCVDEE